MENQPNAYRVDGETFKLPQASHGQPLSTSVIAGLIDTWPAHSSGRSVPTSQMVLTKNKRLLVLDESATKLPNLVPKPHFLESLEKHIRKELHRHHVTQVEPNTVRLQIYREAFEWLIDAFKTYRPLLAEVKREYEMMLAHYRDEIRKLEPMKEMLWTLSQDCDQKIMKMRDEEKQGIRLLRDENTELQIIIAELTAESVGLKMQIEKLKSELTKEHENYRNAADGLKILNIEFNNIRSELAESNKPTSDKDNNAETSQMLKLAYDQAKKAHSEAIAKLNRMEADYNDVVPRRDFEKLNADFSNLNETVTQLTATTQTSDQVIARLKTQVEDCIKQRDEYYTKYELLQRTSTPRPDWTVCAENIHGGLDRWHEITDKKSSAEKVAVLMDELVGGGAGNKNSFLTPKGLEETVPKFLRHDQPVINKRMNKRDCFIHMREFWELRKTEKEKAAESGGSLQEFNDFLNEAFKMFYGVESMRLEWAYSFYDALERFQSDDKARIFLGIINGELDEECYWELIRRFADLLRSFKENDKEERNLLSKSTFREILLRLFPKSSEEQVSKLMSIMEKEIEAETDELVEYEKLFLSDEEGEVGLFLQEIKAMLYKEKEQYIAEIAAEMSELGDSKVNADTLRRAIGIIDPSIEPQQLDYYVSWAFQTPASEVDQSAPEEIHVLTDRLLRGNVFRVGRRN